MKNGIIELWNWNNGTVKFLKSTILIKDHKKPVLCLQKALIRGKHLLFSGGDIGDN